MKNVWESDVQSVAAELGTDAVRGLSAREAELRLAKDGPNQLQEQAGAGPWALFLGQFKDVIVWVLAGAALVSGFLKEWVDAGAILGIVILNAILGFVQEYRAEKALAALRKMANPVSRVIRDGSLQSVASMSLVPGDLVELEAGDHVPADARLIWATANFAAQEASLTGESAPVEKHPDALLDAAAPLAERVNVVYMGTAIVSGKARALIVATGMRTELGRIAGMIQSIEAGPTPLQQKLDAFGRLLVRICFVLVAVVFLAQAWRAGWRLDALGDVFLTAVSLAVAAIPEGLPAVVTLALALGVQRMVRRHVLIRKLPSVETLGCATVICTDKTGTLTRNEMTVEAVYAGGRLYAVSGEGYEPRGAFLDGGAAIEPGGVAPLREALLCAALCNGANLKQVNGSWQVTGDPTEGALLAAAGKAGLDRAALERERPLVEELPFDSTRKRMTMIRRGAGGRLVAYVKGAPDVLLPLCGLDRESQADITRVNAELAGRGLRVLGVACRELPPDMPAFTDSAVECGLTFKGLLAMMDPPRPEARAAMAVCRAAGIRAVMITGDAAGTAAAVGRDLTMLGEGDRILTGADIEKLDDAGLERMVVHVPVYARVAPEHKLRIVRAWKRRGEIVAMTGDGVNDAPALKEADIGVAMGVTGTDVTKEVADMIVTDDNFASIVAAVEEGRGIYDNILKFVRYLLSCNIGEILVMLVASLAGMPPPLLPIQILWVNLVTDGLPALALGMEPPDSGNMRRPPRNPAEPVVGRADAVTMLLQGAFIAGCSLGMFWYVYSVKNAGIEAARTGAFLVLSLSQLVHAFNCRHMTASLFRLGVFGNRHLVAATAVSLALQVLVVLTPGLQGIFKTGALSGSDWLVAAAVASLPLWLVEAVKWVLRRRAGGPGGSVPAAL